MSIFNAVDLSCPSCGGPVHFNAVFSLNADRRKDLRMAVLDGSFQRETCAQCGKGFRLDPSFTYIDVEHDQWIAAHPYARLDEWEQLERQARATFNKAYGASASKAAKEIGERMKPRITFGWAGLREKIVAAEVKLDDVVLELTKSALIRGIDEAPIGIGTEIRLIDVEQDTLVFAWIDGVNEKINEILRTPRAIYNEIVADRGSWSAIEETLTSGPFVDMNKMLVAAKA